MSFEVFVEMLIGVIPYLGVFLFSVFLFSLVLQNNSIMDIAWGIGFMITAGVSFAQLDEVGVRAMVVTTLVFIWGIRLAFRIGKRNFGKPEDFRYAKWRGEWGRWFILRSLLQIYVLQGILLLVVISPVLLAQRGTAPIGILDILGLMIWVIGFYFEARSDYELDKFLHNANMKGKLLMDGLWSYSRHPNYFGEACMWWGLWFVALSGGVVGALTIIGPITITVLLRYVSGVPLVEARMSSHPDFSAYRIRTSMFFPWLPKKDPV